MLSGNCVCLFLSFGRDGNSAMMMVTYAYCLQAISTLRLTRPVFL